MTNRLPSEVADYYRGREDLFIRDLRVMGRGQEMVQGGGAGPPGRGGFTIGSLNRMKSALGPYRKGEAA